MRVCDFVADFLNQKAGIKDIFLVSGGGLMFLTDGLACNQKINKVCCHHEQAASMAAVAYAKYNEAIGCAYITTGCGGTNAITGLLNAWQDNTPCIFISGQCKRKETLRNLGLPIRQIGVQEADIISIVGSITKYSVMVNEPEQISYHLEKALYLANSGRKGPVWIDIPMDIQSSQINKKELKHFDPKELDEQKIDITDEELNSLLSDIKNSKRPIIIAGGGIRLAGATDEFSKFIHKYKIPFVTSRMGTDIMPTEDNLYIGRIGNKGTRAANFAVANADLVIAMGSRLSVSSTGQQYNFFAQNAKKVIAIDIDKYEHKKNTVRINEIINADIKNVLSKLNLHRSSDFDSWKNWCLDKKNKYPVCLPEYKNDENGINIYAFVDVLSECLKKDSVVIGDAGSAVYVPPQALRTKTKEQRYITSGGQAEMGFSLPAAIGVSTARGKGEVLAITGDGSLQMNIQELQTLVHYDLPVKLFVWNNDGYLSIRATQKKFFNGRFLGTDSNSGVSFPNLKKIAAAYGIKYCKISKYNKIKTQIKKVMSFNEPVIIEVMCIPNQLIIPTISSKQMPDGKLVSMPPENMFPFLSEEEFKSNMISE